MAINRLEISELDFDSIKNNLKSFLKQQSEFSDYDFDGSGLNILLDILAYNTHYNSYYLNMVANEAFLDTAILRDSVVSHAKTLGYTPYSMSAAKAVCNVVIDSTTTTAETLTMPRGFTFASNVLDNSVYNFVVIDDVTVTKSGTNFFFENLPLYQGQIVNYQFSQDNTANPKQVFVLPDASVDTKTIIVSVRPSSSNTESIVYNRVTDILDVNATSEVYFLQESRSGKFQINFGDDSIGKKLADGSIVNISYLTTNGSLSNGCDGFVPAQALLGLTQFNITTIEAAAGGSDRESVDEIRASATSQFATQNRLVTFKDYESHIKRNYPALDSISVWGGEEEVPPVYGKVFISMKPKANYFISETEKKRIIDELITPKSIVSVQAEIIDPDYLYLLVNSYVKYDPRRTTTSDDNIKTNIRNAIISYRNTYLNKFASRFVLSKIQDEVDDTNMNAIIGSEMTLRLQKRFRPHLNENRSYRIDFTTPLHRGTISNKILSTAFNVYDNNGVERTVTFDEIPQSYSGISSISVTDPGSGYTTAPTVTITGDGSGAEATATIVNGRVQSINISKRGIDYTRAIISITGGGGFGAVASAVIDARTGTIRTIYYDSNAERQVVNDNAGTIEYDTGIIDIFGITIRSVSSSDGLIRLSIESEVGIVESNKHTILTIDEDDSSSITVDLVKI